MADDENGKFRLEIVKYYPTLLVYKMTSSRIQSVLLNNKNEWMGFKATFVHI